jgi:hypothetical protein
MVAPDDERVQQLLSASDKLYSETAASASSYHVSAEKAWWSPRNAMTMCCAVLLFGLLAMLLATWIAARKTGSQKDMTIQGLL